MSHSRAQLEELLRSVAVEVARIKPEQITLQANLIEDLGLDSLDFFDIIALLNQKLDKSFFIEDFKAIVTVEDFLNKLEELV